MIIKRLTASTRQILSMMALASFTPYAAAETTTQADEACGTLTKMGGHTYLVNHSQYDWNVVFITTAINEAFGVSYNAGAVKYLADDARWVDTGIGDYRSAKTYTVPVPAYETVPIAYCADRSHQNHRIDGRIFFIPVNPALVHGSPDGNVVFSGENGTPAFFNHGFTPYVEYNKNAGYFENGSLKICPNDSECKIP